jgi:hypothetical protein
VALELVARYKRSAMKAESAEQQLAGFIAKYAPEVGAVAAAALAKVRARLRGAVELVYDNYNALAIGFAPTERTADIIVSITLYPRWVSLFFYHGADLPDPQKLLRGSGKQVRHIVLESAATVDQPAVRTLIAQALERAVTPLNGKNPRRVVIKLIAAKRRPRRPT